MLIRVFRAVLFLFLARVLNLTTEVNVRALSFILVPLKRFMLCKVNYFWLSFNVKLTELAVAIIKGLRMIRLLCWQVIASACCTENEREIQVLRESWLQQRASQVSSYSSAGVWERTLESKFKRRRITS